MESGGSRRTFRVALYCRVSTSEQTVDLQLDALREFCHRRGWQIVEEYLDVGVSGAKAKRPQLDRLLTDVRKGRLDVVLIWKLDRLARSFPHLLRLSEEFESLGIDLCSCTEPIDTTTSLGKFVFVLLGALAEFERNLIRERVCAGMRAAKARGKKIGRPRLLPSEKDLEELRDLREQGLSIREIAKRVVWFPENDGAARSPSPSLVHRYVKAMEEDDPPGKEAGGDEE